jgi:hypothetical protein
MHACRSKQLLAGRQSAVAAADAAVMGGLWQLQHTAITAAAAYTEIAATQAAAAAAAAVV